VVTVATHCGDDSMAVLHDGPWPWKGGGRSLHLVFRAREGGDDMVDDEEGTCHSRQVHFEMVVSIRNK
jgi:hypothetical protein